MDFGANAYGFAEEDGGRGVAVGDGLNVQGSMIQLYKLQYKTKQSTLHGYIITRCRIQICKAFKALRGKWRQKERELRFRVAHTTILSSLV
jgi:hypothetical protein